MVVHAANEGAQITPDAFNFTRVFKLELFVNVSRMLYWPVVGNVAVNATAVSPELGSGLDLLKQEACRMLALGVGLVDELPG